MSHQFKLRSRQTKSSVQRRASAESEYPLNGASTTAQVLQLQRLIGNRATTHLLQRQGSLSVLAGSDDTEQAKDKNSLSQSILGDSSSNGLVDKMKKQGNQALFDSQHPSFAQQGIVPGQLGGNKSAVLIGNSDYTPPAGIRLDPLTGVKDDIEKMKMSIVRQKYLTFVQQNRTGAQIEASYQQALDQAKPGDSVFLYYAGHGLTPGMVGMDIRRADQQDAAGGAANGQRGMELVEDSTPAPANTGTSANGAANASQSAPPKQPDNSVMLGSVPLLGVAPYARVISTLETAAAQGVHVTFVVDACHSGAATDLVRTHAINKLDASRDPKLKGVQSQLKRLEDLKAQIPKQNTAAFWNDTAFAELSQVNLYLASQNADVPLTRTLSDTSRASIEQQINRIINALIDLGDKLTEEKQTPTP